MAENTEQYTPDDEAHERFWSSVDRGDGCWLWTRALYWDGYGQFHVGGITVRAHRWSYEQEYGAIPEGLVIDHVKARGCRSRACVNPAHLEAVTNRENVLRGDGPASRTHCPKGHEYSPKSDGTRYCRTCHRRREEARRRRGGTKWTCSICGKTVQVKSRHIKTHQEA